MFSLRDPIRLLIAKTFSLRDLAGLVLNLLLVFGPNQQGVKRFACPAFRSPLFFAP